MAMSKKNNAGLSTKTHKPRSEPYTKVGLSLSTELLAAVHDQAERDGQSLRTFLERALRAYLEERKRHDNH